jgi:hypothetical protein
MLPRKRVGRDGLESRSGFNSILKDGTPRHLAEPKGTGRPLKSYGGLLSIGITL